jgi:gas vesicle structural protein
MYLLEIKAVRPDVRDYRHDVEQSTRSSALARGFLTLLEESTFLRGLTEIPCHLQDYYRGSSSSYEEMNKMAVEKSMASSSLVEVVDRILDKGVVVDAWVRISLVGIELLAIETRVVIASVETYLKYAEAIGLTATAAAATA